MEDHAWKKIQIEDRVSGKIRMVNHALEKIRYKGRSKQNDMHPGQPLRKLILMKDPAI